MPEREWKIKTDIVDEAKELPKEELKKQKIHQVFQQKQGSGNRTPGSTKFTTKKQELDHMEDNTKAEHDLDTIEDREPEVDAYRGILLVQKATAVTGQTQIGRLEMKSRQKNNRN